MILIERTTKEGALERGVALALAELVYLEEQGWHMPDEATRELFDRYKARQAIISNLRSSIIDPPEAATLIVVCTDYAMPSGEREQLETACLYVVYLPQDVDRNILAYCMSNETDGLCAILDTLDSVSVYFVQQ